MESLGFVNAAILIGAVLVLIGIFSSLVATRFGAPLLLVFLVLGMLAGEDGPGGLAFDDYRLTYLIGSLALSVILFDGGLRTKLSTFREAVTPALLLATVGVLVTASVIGAVAYALFAELSPLEALLLGSIVASTDAAAVFFLLRTGGMQLQRRIGSVLEIESGTNDPIAVFLTIVLTELLIAGVDAPGWQVVARLAEQGLIGAALGGIGGLAAVTMLNRVQMPDGLHPLFVVASAISIYATTSLLGGSGLLAVYLAGLVMANRPVRAYPSIVGFHDAAMWFSQIVMFLVLGLLVTPSTLVEYVVPGVIIGLALIFVARPLAVWLCLSPFRFAEKEKLFVSWVGLRGAVSIFLAAIPTLAAVPHAEAYFNIAFFVVMISLLVQGWSLNGVARRLGLALRRSAPSVRRFEVDIPGQTEQEMIGYPVAPDSLIMGLTRVPAWARIVLIVRDGDIVDPAEAGPLADGDYVYLLASPERVPRLDRLFSESPDVARRKTPLFGELPINGGAGIGDIAALYDIDVPEAGGAMTVAEFFTAYLRNPPLPGARLPLGNATLVVREVEDGTVLRAGLQLDELVDALLARSLAYAEPVVRARIVRDRAARVLASLRNRLRRR